MDPQNDPDVQLMMRVKEGDRDAFAQLFERHFASVARFLRWLLHDPARAEELAQDVFLSLYRARARYQPRSRFRAFLFRIATHVAIGEQRSRVREQRLLRGPSSTKGQSPEDLGTWIDRHGQQDSEESRLVRKERVLRLVQALQELPERQRAALLLVRSEGLSYEQAGEALGATVQAVKSLVHRATVYLRKRCQEEAA